MKNSRACVFTTMLDAPLGFDECVSEFVNAFYKLFPSYELEKKYVLLTNLVFEFFNVCGCLKVANKELDKRLGELTKCYRAEQVSRVDCDINDFMEFLKHPEKTSSYYYSLASNASYFASLAADYAGTLKNIEEVREKIFNCEQKASEARTELASIVKNIKTLLEEIVRISVDSGKSLDDVTLLSEFPQAFARAHKSLKETWVLRYWLFSYFNLRVLGFRYVEDFAVKILDWYKNREIPDAAMNFEIDDNEFTAHFIAFLALKRFPLKKKRMGLVDESDGTLFKELYASLCQADFLVGYLNTGIFDHKAYLDCMSASSSLSYVCSTLANIEQRKKDCRQITSII